MKTRLTIDSDKISAQPSAETPRLVADETLIRDRKSLRVRSDLRAGIWIKMKV